MTTRFTEPDREALRLRLNNSLLEANVSPSRFSFDAGLQSPSVVRDFVEGKSRPQARTIGLIADEMRRRGWLPDSPQSPAPEPVVEKAKELPMSDNLSAVDQAVEQLKRFREKSVDNAMRLQSDLEKELKRIDAIDFIIRKVKNGGLDVTDGLEPALGKKMKELQRKINDIEFEKFLLKEKLKTAAPPPVCP